MKELRVGIIGCGNIYGNHAEPISQVEGIRLVAVADNKEDRAKKASEKHNCDYYIDYIEMLDKAELDVVHICTPHYLHPIMAREAAKRKIHILTEKPMSIAYEDAKMMVDVAKEEGVTLGVIFQNRYNPGSLLIKEALDSGKLGKVLGARLYLAWDRSDEYYTKSDWKGTWDKEGGGVIIDQAIHTLDLANWFLGQDIEWISAGIYNRAHDIIEVEDVAEGVIKYKNGVSLAFHTINYYTRDAKVEIELHCEKGIAKIEASKGSILYNDGQVVESDNKKNGEAFLGKSYWGDSHRKQIAAFYEDLKHGQQPFLSGDEALKTQKLVCSIYESGKSKEKVYF